MPRDRRSSAANPVFASYLLPSFDLLFPRRSSAPAESSSPLSPASPASPRSPSPTAPAPPGPATRSPGRSLPRPRSPAPPHNLPLARAAPDSLRCLTCSADLALSSQVVSKGFTGRHGRAFLVSPPRLPAPQTLANIRVGPSEDRQLVTGWHTVADICCAICSRKLGWKYVDAKEQSQKYKIGKYILETERVVTHRTWEHLATYALDDAVSQPQHIAASQDVVGADDISFDSADEEECEDLFAAAWDPESVARNRRRRAFARRPTAGTS